MESIQNIKNLYQKRASHYDLSANLYYLLGFREQAYRRMAVTALNLQSGDTVIEIGCGTGLNFSLLQKKVGPQGKIIGVDLTPSMLEMAHERCKRHGWNNVKLIEHEAGSYEFPAGIDGALSTFALTLVPGYQRVIEHAHQALTPGKNLVVGDFRIAKWPGPLLKFGIFLTSPFGVTLELGQRRPWEAMEAVFGNLHMQTRYFESVYIATSTKPRSEQ
jgi:ubiquinone/menaquinone biosynthesis C-methylase UbiE